MKELAELRLKLDQALSKFSNADMIPIRTQIENSFRRLQIYIQNDELNINIYFHEIRCNQIWILSNFKLFKEHLFDSLMSHIKENEFKITNLTNSNENLSLSENYNYVNDEYNMKEGLINNNKVNIKHDMVENVKYQIVDDIYEELNDNIKRTIDEEIINRNDAIKDVLDKEIKEDVEKLEKLENDMKFYIEKDMKEEIEVLKEELKSKQDSYMSIITANNMINFSLQHLKDSILIDELRLNTLQLQSNNCMSNEKNYTQNEKPTHLITSPVKTKMNWHFKIMKLLSILANDGKNELINLFKIEKNTKTIIENLLKLRISYTSDIMEFQKFLLYDFNIIIKNGSLENDTRFYNMVEKTLLSIEKYDSPIFLQISVQLEIAKKYIRDVINIKKHSNLCKYYLKK
ncbi:hypothetical protein TCON_2185 [Astathelohania contejeani]|uniref:Uncharacterized protein n=1 Tax=Astathelohania contejeani TaxID=164912 RepID=A0ABQ7HWR4_9MICR|nr:hypothetical protein TCON_2185 [Thelohania contejeani]